MSRHQPGVNPLLFPVILISLLLIIGLVKNALGLYQSRERLETIQAEVNKLQLRKQTLEQTLLLQSDPAYLDQSIRNQLNLAKPGETIISIIGSESSLSKPASPAATPPHISPLSQWWQLLNP